MKWKLGEIARIGVFVHWSFWILPGLILMSALSAGGGMGAAIGSLVFLFAIFGCVVLHEVGHALAARHFGIGTRDITLYPIGGVASLNRIPRNPYQELVIALAGPAVNVVLAGLFFLAIVSGLGALLPLAASPLDGSFLMGLMWANVVLVLFNLVPAFPMDGGRVLRAFLAMQLPYVQATEIAAKVGQAVAVVLGLVGLYLRMPILFLVALFVFLAAQAEARMARMDQLYQGFSGPGYAQPDDYSRARRVVEPEPVAASADGDDDAIRVTEVRTFDPRTGTMHVVRYPTSP